MDELQWGGLWPPSASKVHRRLKYCHSCHIKSFGSRILTIFSFLFLLIMGFKIQIFERKAFLGKTNRSFSNAINRMQTAV